MVAVPEMAQDGQVLPALQVADLGFRGHVAAGRRGITSGAPRAGRPGRGGNARNMSPMAAEVDLLVECVMQEGESGPKDYGARTFGPKDQGRPPGSPDAPRNRPKPPELA